MDRRKLVENCDIIKTALGCMQSQSKEGCKIVIPNSVTVMPTSQSIHTARFVVDQHRTEFNDIRQK
ncbi:MAG: hypothetical protein J6B87_06970 [Clostridia bacterium]|nr:hypothetical protein [Clostridia bacterium]